MAPTAPGTYPVMRLRSLAGAAQRAGSLPEMPDSACSLRCRRTCPNNHADGYFSARELVDAAHDCRCTIQARGDLARWLNDTNRIACIEIALDTLIATADAAETEGEAFRHSTIEQVMRLLAQLWTLPEAPALERRISDAARELAATIDVGAFTHQVARLAVCLPVRPVDLMVLDDYTHHRDFGAEEAACELFDTWDRIVDAELVRRAHEEPHRVLAYQIELPLAVPVMPSALWAVAAALWDAHITAGVIDLTAPAPVAEALAAHTGDGDPWRGADLGAYASDALVEAFYTLARSEPAHDPGALVTQARAVLAGAGRGGTGASGAAPGAIGSGCSSGTMAQETR